MLNSYLPEGMLLHSSENREALSSLAGLERAMNEGKILEATVLLCDSALRLHVDLYGIKGIIEKEDAVFCRRGEERKDIAVITRVGKPTCFKVIGFEQINGEKVAKLSRRAAQEECIRCYLGDLMEGDIIPARVTHMESFGAFVDIGCGVPSLLSVDSISVSRISHPSDRLSVGESIYTVVKAIDRAQDRIFVSTRELLGTWEENAKNFEIGQTVAGIVRSIEPYGVFIELAPNLAGLAELREGSSDRRLAVVGEHVAVYIKNIIPDRMKIKLVLIDSYRGEIVRRSLPYYIDGAHIHHIDAWRYSPEGATKMIESVFQTES